MKTQETLVFGCSCKEWKECEPQIRGAQVLAAIHEMHYNGATFRYCPWCGKTLKLLVSGIEGYPEEKEG